MNKNWYKSLTFWSAIAWGIVEALNQLSITSEPIAQAAQAIAVVLGIFGIRRAIK